MEIHEKKCWRCETVLPLSVFGKNRSRHDGLADECKPCRRDAVAAYRAKHPERARESLRKSQSRPVARARQSAYMSEYQKRNDVKQRHRARNAVKDALRSGALLRPLLCGECGNRPDLPVQAHHHDYAKPLDVSWLCTLCHAALHAKLRQSA